MKQKSPSGHAPRDSSGLVLRNSNGRHVLRSSNGPALRGSNGLVLRGSNGFTLIELMVVIAIIGLLSSVAIVATGPSRAKSRDAKRQADIRQIASAMELCYDDKTCSGGNGQQYLLVSTVTGPEKITGYLDPVPKDPVTGLGYSWSTNAGVQNKYCVYVKLEVPAATTYFAASEKGINSALTVQPPSVLGTCW